MLPLSRLLSVSGLIISLACAEETPFVKIPQGLLVGLESKSILHNVTFYSFKGIPYAKPNLGEHKFDPPQPPEPWNGLLNATEHREICPQYNTIFDYYEGDEDCLFLNVYTPSLNPDSCKAVMVWIHAGGFNFGQSNTDYYAPDFLMERDVVVVTFNYRLGPIGFLCTSDEYAPGNMGLKDQTYAFRWVRNNIQYFGGCPDKVTIFGHDAGAVSVGYHMLSPMSRGLFHRAIAQSGSMTDFWGFVYNPKPLAQRVARSLGVDTESSKTLVDLFKKLPTKDIILANSKFFYIKKDLPEVELYFLPCKEAKVEGQEQFLPDTPINLLLAGDIADVPLMTGVTEDEGAFSFTAALNITALIKGENITLREKFALRDNMEIHDPDHISSLYEEVYKFYFGDTPLSKLTIPQMKPLVSDTFYLIQHHVTTLILNEHITSNIYKYIFAYKSTDGVTRPFAEVGNVSTHADDLEYIFFFDGFAAIPEFESNAYTINRLMTKLWTNFAKTGDPTSLPDETINAKWKPMGRENNIMRIDIQQQMNNTYYPENMKFWLPKFQHLFGKFVNLIIN